MSLNQLHSKMRRLAELRQERDIDKKTAEKSELAYREYEAELLVEAQASGLKGSITQDFGGDLGTVKFTFKKPTVYGTVTNREKAEESLKELGRYSEIFAPSVQKGRLNELIRELKESGHDLPEGLGTYDQQSITISHVRNK